MTEEHDEQLWDAIVIGGGAAGLSTALALGRARRRTLVIDAGSPRNRFATHMHSVLGNEGVPPTELLRRGRAEIAAYGVEVREGATERVTASRDEVTVALADGGTLRTRALVVATGITDELPAIPGLAERWGRTVLHCPYCHGWEVADQRIGVLATSPAGLHHAFLLRQWSDRVTFFAAAATPLDASVVARLESRGVRIVTASVAAVDGDGDRIDVVRTADGVAHEIDALYTAGTPIPHDRFLAELDLERTELPMVHGTFLVVDQRGRTSHPRVWAVGNVVNPMANVPLAIGAGAFTGPAVNAALVEWDFDAAMA